MVSSSPRSWRPAGRGGGQTTDVDLQLARRRLGHGRGARMTFEQDEVDDPRRRPARRHPGRPDRHPGRQHRVAQVGRRSCRADPVDAEVLAGLARNAPLTRPRPGHADLAGMQKYGFDDARPVLERASARETAARVALGAVAQAFLRQALGVEVVSHVVAIGAGAAPDGVLPGPAGQRPHRRGPGALRRPGDERAMVAEIDDGRQERRHPRRGGRGRRPRAAAGPGQPRALGPPAGLPAGRCADGHPGGQGRSRSATAWRPPRRRGSVAHDEIDLRPDGAVPSGAPTAPAASRAA